MILEKKTNIDFLEHPMVVLDYIPGPTWLDDLGCYPEDKEKYLQEDKFDVEDDMDINDKDNFDFNDEIEDIKKENSKKSKKKIKRKKWKKNLTMNGKKSKMNEIFSFYIFYIN